jgi:protoheme IX farnesyltransferase
MSPPLVRAGEIAAEAPRLLRARLADLAEISKPRVTSMVLATTLAGFYMGSRGAVDLLLLLHTLLGTALAAAGASALNQYVEREEDGRMLRTRGRPLPAGRLEPAHALLFGCLLSAAGVAHLLLAVNRVAAGLVALTVLTYVFAYTPMKTRTFWCTLVGSLPGALPPLVGWAAAEGAVTTGGVVLFLILFFWQLPHALAIACLYREDYERGGFKLMPVVMGGNALTGRVIVALTLLLVPITLLPSLWGYAGGAYFWGGLAMGLLLLLATWPLALEPTARSARRVLLATVFYLPALLGLLALDRRLPLR